jgi:ubiquinone/menaquinone biosynthesis C-methylase UbiE
MSTFFIARRRCGMAMACTALLAVSLAQQLPVLWAGDQLPPNGDDPPIPPALKFYMGREIAPFMDHTGAPWLVRDTRQNEENCQALLEALEIKEGQVVCDMGCGNGFYTLQMARLVGEKGRVLAVDIQPEMLELLNAEVKTAGLNNIEPILGTVVNPRLPEETVDLMLMVDVYHEFSHPEPMLAAIRKSLKPEGRLALVEFRLEDPEVPIKLLHKMSKKQIMKEFPHNGFKLAREFDELPWQHLMFFQPDPD